MRVFVNERYVYALSILATDLIKAHLSLLFAVAVQKAGNSNRLPRRGKRLVRNLIYNTPILKLIYHKHWLIIVS